MGHVVLCVDWHTLRSSMGLNDLCSGLLRWDRWAVYSSRSLIGVLQI